MMYNLDVKAYWWYLFVSSGYMYEHSVELCVKVVVWIPHMLAWELDFFVSYFFYSLFLVNFSSDELIRIRVAFFHY